MNAGIFLDRDGVLVADVHLLTKIEQLSLLPGVPAALLKLANHGFKLIVVTNQTVVARGLATEAEVGEINRHLNRLITTAGGGSIDEFYVCPHHPKANLEEYRLDCDCRKPRAGLLYRAAREHGLNLGGSFMIGDRITDIIAGAHAGCRTVLLTTGAHELPPIETADALDASVKPTFTCSTLTEAADWIIKTS